MNWNEIFSPDLFIEDMLYREEIHQDELDRKDPYGMMVGKLCHNSVVWMYKRVLEDYPDLLNQLFLVTGSYTMGGIFNDLRMEHSWVEYRKDCSVVVLDLTVSQFRKINDRLYIGECVEDFNEYEAISFGDADKIKELILTL